ncbi:MAG: DMT family transporter [Alphaproteobacteria bacterium]|nr:DMT family transporter [Alphaproteobacteria bacterium]
MSGPSAPQVRRATLVLLGSAFIWGSMIPFMNELSRTYDNFLLALSRYALGLPVLWLIVAFVAPPASAPRPIEPGKLFRLCAAMTAFGVLYTFGVAWAHPATSAIVLMCGPIWAALLSRAMLAAPTPRGFVPTLAVVMLGGLLVVFGAPGRPTGGLGLQGGELLLVVAQLCWSWHSIRAQQWLGDRGQIRLSAITTTVASLQLLSIVGVLAALGMIAMPPRVPTASEWGMLAWIGVLGVAIALLFWNTGVSLVGVPVASLFSNTAPIFAIGVAVLMGSDPTWLQLAGGAIVLAAIANLQLRQIRAHRETRP